MSSSKKPKLFLPEDGKFRLAETLYDRDKNDIRCEVCDSNLRSTTNAKELQVVLRRTWGMTSYKEDLEKQLYQRSGFIRTAAGRTRMVEHSGGGTATTAGKAGVCTIGTVLSSSTLLAANLITLSSSQS